MDLNTLNIVEAVEKLKTKKISPVDLVDACFERINQIDPDVHAFLALNKEQALHEAREIEQIITDDAFSEKPLLGIPVAIKDNFTTAGLETTASSKILQGYIPQFDATVVSKLKTAGAIIIGKTNMDAFAHGSSTETSDFGPTKNPWNKNHLPGGSSGGSVAAVAADEPLASIGSETAGSIRGPAAWCGVVGLKPTYGRVSRYGLMSMASSTDSPGPITKTVEDSEILFQIIAGFDPLDATSSHEKIKKANKNFDVKKLKIGIPKEYYRSEAQKGVNDKVMAGAKLFEKLGATLIDISTFDPKYAVSVYTILQRSEVSSNLARFDGIRFGHQRSEFNDENKRRIMLGTYTLSAGYYDEFYKKAQKVRTLIVDDFNKAFNEVDLLLAPTLPSTAPKIGVTEGESMFGELADILTEPSSIAGLPGISLPSGLIDGLPVGLQLIGPMWSEDVILGASYVYEKEVGPFEKPKL